MALVVSAGSCFDGRPDCTIPPQAITACPAAKMLSAPTVSAWSECPHATQANSACVLRLSFDTWPQHGHVRLVFLGSTATKYPPRHAVLYSSWRRNLPQPWSRIDLLRPDFARTLRPGASTVPFASLLKKLGRASEIPAGMR